MKVNLGAGNIILAGYINHDISKHRKEIELVFDLEDKQWPVTAGEAEEIRAFDVLEHLEDVIGFMNNCWDWLGKGGILDMKVCGWQNPNAHVDITHKRPGFDIRSFDYFDPALSLGREYGYYTDKKWTILSNDYDRRKNIMIRMTPIK